MRDERGSASLLTVLLLPLLALTVAIAIDLGALRVAATRARSSADLAALVAVNDQDPRALAERGALRLSGDAEEVAREYLARNLALLGPALAAEARTVASQADVAVLPEGGVDRLDGARFSYPTVRIRAQVPLRAGLLAAITGPVVPIEVHVAAAAR